MINEVLINFAVPDSNRIGFCSNLAAYVVSHITVRWLCITEPVVALVFPKGVVIVLFIVFFLKCTGDCFFRDGGKPTTAVRWLLVVDPFAINNCLRLIIAASALLHDAALNCWGSLSAHTQRHPIAVAKLVT